MRVFMARLFSSDTNIHPAVERAMLFSAKSSRNTMKSRRDYKLLRRLTRAGVGTGEVEEEATRMIGTFSERMRRLHVKRVMKRRTKDALDVFRMMSRENDRVWAVNRRFIPESLMDAYMYEWRQMMRRETAEIVLKHDRKFEHLCRKWDRKKKVPNVYKGVRIGDESVDMNEFTAEPRIYDGLSVSENGRAALSLQPGYGVYGKINIDRLKIDSEECANKYRWNVKSGLVRERENEMQNSQEGRENVNSSMQEERGDQSGIEGAKKEFVDRESMRVNANKLEATSLPYNFKVTMPVWVGEEKEDKLKAFQTGVIEEAKKLIGPSKTWYKESVSENVKEGIDELTRKVKNREIVCFQTDKSGRMSVDSVDNFEKACKEQLNEGEKTVEITDEEHDMAEREMNAEGQGLMNMMGLSGDKGGDERVLDAIRAVNVCIPPMYGLRKDHKVVEESMRESGPKVRPVCGAKDCVTKRVSHLLCQIFSPLVEGNDSHCKSTSELIGEIERINETPVDEGWIVGSLDVDALYPSLDIEKCTAVLVERLIESEMVFDNLEWKEVGMYLKYHMETEEIERKGYTRYCPKWKVRPGRKPMFIANGTARDKNTRQQAWIFPKQTPPADVVRRMFCDALGCMVKKTMSVHDFMFSGKIYRQLSGGAIGMDLTGVLADVYLCKWDKQLMQGMSENGIECKLYKRYIDDINVIAKTSAQGGDREKVTMASLKRIADGIDESLTVKTDVTSEHDDGKVPILDLKVWIGKGKDGCMKVLHEHYMKDVSSRMVIHVKSAHGERMKQNVLTNDIVRVMRNCSKELSESEGIGKHVSYYMRRMQYSGYSEQMRYQVLKRAFDVFEGKEQTAPSSERKSGKKKKHNWYMKDNKSETVMVVDATPKECLKKAVEKVAKLHKLKVKVVERRGRTIKNMLQKSNPFPTRKCSKKDCVICVKNMGVDCRKRGVVYEVFCKEEGCGKKYVGQTGRTLYERMKDHMAQNKNMDRAGVSALEKHKHESHGGREYDYGVRVRDNAYGRPSKRMLSEMVRIESMKENECFNRKRGWSYTQPYRTPYSENMSILESIDE